MEKKKILVVDDEPDLVEFVKLRLEANNYDVLVAEDGEQALEVMAKTTPDLILLDIVLPKMDGHKVCEVIKKDPKFANIPVLMLTAKDREEDIKLAKKCGAEGYMIKPFDAQVLLFDIKSLLKSKIP